MDERGSEMADQLNLVGRTHVIVPIAWLDKVLAVYYAAKAGALVPAQFHNGPTVVQGRTGGEEPGTWEFEPGYGVPSGYTPMGTAARKEPDDGG